MISRRGLIGGALTFPLACGCANAANDGCNVEGAAAETLINQLPRTYSFNGKEEIIYSSGNELLDRALTRALYRLSQDFEVLPGFGYLPNLDTALATQATRLARADGTVLFGLPFLQRTLRRPEHPDACVVSICAHEFAHIYQYKSNLHKALRQHQQASIELHADFLSGWFSGVRKRNNPDYPSVVFATLARDIQSNFGASRETHGTPEDRGRAVEAGFLSAARDNLTLYQAAQEGLRYLDASRTASDNGRR